MHHEAWMRVAEFGVYLLVVLIALKMPKLLAGIKSQWAKYRFNRRHKRIKRELEMLPSRRYSVFGAVSRFLENLGKSFDPHQ